MTTKNDITGDELVSKTNSDAYRDGWDRIFGKKQNRNLMKVIQENTTPISNEELKEFLENNHSGIENGLGDNDLDKVGQEMLKKHTLK